MSADSIPANVSHLSRVERNAANDGRFGGGRFAESRAPAAPRYDSDAPKKKFVAKGHDSQLQDAQFGKDRVRIKMVSGDTVYGTIARRDKFTITLLHEAAGPGHADEEAAGLSEIIYKHAIEGVLVFPGV